MQLKKWMKIGFKHVAIGLIVFIVLAVILNLLKIWTMECMVGLGVGVMAAALMNASKESYIAGLNDAPKGEEPEKETKVSVP